ncbi:MAG TPA: hypothetical protein VMP08_19885 [Anaerolineae bacterium]|nr:hypothetical protein [Anaerolineae bacterium]
MFGLAHLVVSAERDLRDNARYARDEQRSKLLAWLGDHKVLWFAAVGALIVLLIGENAA